MQIIIPMTGLGSRFKNAGYEELKPMIQVGGKSIIDWVTKIFDKQEDHFVLICQTKHIEDGLLNIDYLKSLGNNVDILSVRDWKKLGPAYEIFLMEDILSTSEECIISYCDYFVDWDYKLFLKGIKDKNFDGAIPCYQGFHPHLLDRTHLYAACKTDNKDQLVTIKEKHTWYKDITKNKYSPGIYYFRDKVEMFHAIKRMVNCNDSINKEFYVSLIYNYLEKGSKVWCPTNINSFCQWGTPQDLQEYLKWEDYLNNL